MLGIAASFPEAKQQTEERYRAFMNNIPAIALIKDKAGRILYINEPMSKIYKINFGDVQGKTWADWIPDEVAADSPS